MPSTDVTVTVAASLAEELIARAGIERGENGWQLPDGTATTDPAAALTQALVVIGEDDLSATLHDSLARELA